MTTLRKSLLAAALTFPLSMSAQAVVFEAGFNDIYFQNFENLYRATTACTPETCLAADTNNDPSGYQRVRTDVANNILVGDVFAGILNVQNIESNGLNIWSFTNTDQFTGYFAQQVSAIDPAAGDPSGFDHITLVSPTADPFGLLAVGEMFRLFTQSGVGTTTPFESNGTTFDDITKATDGVFWGSLGIPSSGYTYTHTDLTLILSGINASTPEAFVGLDLILAGPGYNAGSLSLINDINENEVGGVTATELCSAANIADGLACTQIVGTSEIEANPGFGAGTSPWTIRSNDPFRLYVSRVPEPATLSMLGLGLLGLAGLRRRRA